MNPTRCMLTILLALPVLLAQAGDDDKTTTQATPGTSPRAEDTRKGMIQTVTVPGNTDEVNKQELPPVPRAADWVSAWQAAKEACPEASGMRIYYNYRSGPSIEALKVFECVDMMARGELLVITTKQPGQNEESVAIVRASDLVRIEVLKPKPTTP